MKATLGLVFALALLVSGCTDNNMARFGGTASLNKPDPSWQLINITWKEQSLWTLWYEPSSGKCYFKEDSPYGVAQGTVVVEQCMLFAR